MLVVRCVGVVIQDPPDVPIPCAPQSVTAKYTRRAKAIPPPPRNSHRFVCLLLPGLCRKKIEVVCSHIAKNFHRACLSPSFSSIPCAPKNQAFPSLYCQESLPCALAAPNSCCSPFHSLVQPNKPEAFLLHSSRYRLALTSWTYSYSVCCHHPSGCLLLDRPPGLAA